LFPGVAWVAIRSDEHTAAAHSPERIAGSRDARRPGPRPDSRHMHV